MTGFTAFVCVMASLVVSGTGHGFISRSDWGARAPKSRTTFKAPIDTVVIHHSEKPGRCNSEEECSRAMRSIQNYHMDVKGWDDIGYNFAIGDGGVLEGRGMDYVGAHCPKYNNRSIGIVFIGDYSDELPSESSLRVCRELIQFGVRRHYIYSNYQLIGHRQGRDTDCPGDALYAEIQSWDNWTPNPH